MRILIGLALFAAPTVSAQEALYNAARVTPIRSAPVADATSPVVGQVSRGTTVEVIARDRGWVRVKLEGWVRESDLVVADSSLRQLSAADIRSDPSGAQGKLVRWNVQAVSLQTADALRTGLSPGEPYLLALGPGVEKSLVYLTVPPGLLPSVRKLPAMAEVVVVARIRNGRSEPAGVPILDLQSVTRK